MNLSGSVYDYPKYYDVLYSTAWADELRFLNACFLEYADGSAQRIFEPACGTGRLLWRLAAMEHDVCGLDLNPKAVAYCNRRFLRHGFAPAVVQGDMAAFRPEDLVCVPRSKSGGSRLAPETPRPFDAAFNLISSFSHLLSEREALAHLRCVADVLRPGGLYILGFHLIPHGRAACDRERWVATKGALRLTADLEVVERDLHQRLDTVSFQVQGETPGGRFTLQDRFAMRNYTAGQFASLLRAVDRFFTLATFDFRLDISAPITVDEKTEDVIYVLRAK